jgi:elongation factor 1-beta
MEFPDLSGPGGVEFLDNYLSTRSYISGYEMTKNDIIVYNRLGNTFNNAKFVNVLRWHRHVKSHAGKDLPDSSDVIKLAEVTRVF